MRRRAVAGLFALAVAAQPIHAQERYAVDWNAVADESMRHFEALLRIDTSNPPGNESEAAAYLAAVLEREGIASEQHALDPSRSNLVARLSGNGSERPILVMAHTDVVGAQRENWSVDPFAAVKRDGYVYGRGTLDDKDNVTAGLMLMLLLKRADVELDRDVVFLAEAGEEATPQFGVDFMIEEHWDRIEAEYCLAEGGGAVSAGGRVTHVNIATTEKFPMRVQLIARGTAGHGSIPRLDNAVSTLARAVARVSNWRTPLRLNETTRTYFERLAQISPRADAERYRALLDPTRQARAERYLEEHDPENFSRLRTSVVPTMMSAGFRVNVIPSEAEAFFDIRALPDENPQEFYRDLAGVINDPNVEIVPQPIYRPQGPPSGLDNEMFRALEAATERLFPEAVTIPTMLNGATDMAQVRAQGTQCYGFGPVRTLEDIAGGGGAHGDDERILESSLLPLVQFLWYSVIEVATGEH
jgi:acetylornithine deacetylase/succinyl-diaminopimelate desuccinylase-like protein